MTPPAWLEAGRADRHSGWCRVLEFRRRPSHVSYRPDRLVVETIHVRTEAPYGALECFDEHSFYQANDDVTLAVYRTVSEANGGPGGKFFAAWFDNVTGTRIA